MLVIYLQQIFQCEYIEGVASLHLHILDCYALHFVEIQVHMYLWLNIKTYDIVLVAVGISYCCMYDGFIY